MHIQAAREGTPRSVPWCRHSWQCEQLGGSGAAGTPRVLHAAPPTSANKSKGAAPRASWQVLCQDWTLHIWPKRSSESPGFFRYHFFVYTAFSAFTVPYNTKSVVYFLSSGRFGLWLDADLYHGRSNSCSTFNNDILTKKEDFIIQDVEVWTFEWNTDCLKDWIH